MQNRINWTGDTSRIKKGSFLISIFLHFALFSLILITPVKEKKYKRDILIVKLVDLPNIELPQILEPIKEETKLFEANKKQNLKGEKKLKVEQKEKNEKISENTGYFSVEDYRKKIYSKIEKEKKEESTYSSKTDVKMPEIKSLKVFSDENSVNLNISFSSIPEWYIETIKRRIEDKWVINELFVGLSAIVSFRIYRDGKVESIIIEKSSGYRKFDTSIIDAIKSVEKWPEFPKDIKDKYLDVVIEFKTEG